MANRRVWLSWALGAIALAGCGGETPPAEESAAAEVPAIEEAFIPSDFEPPRLWEAKGFKLVPLGPDVMELDYQAYMSSIEHIRANFSGGGWPSEDLTLEDAQKDMDNEQRRFDNRESFAYAVLTPDGSREMGSVYVRPSRKEGYDAVVRMWVTKADFDAGFETKLEEQVRVWVEQEWPFEKVAYPGRGMTMEEWNALPDKPE